MCCCFRLSLLWFLLFGVPVAVSSSLLAGLLPSWHSIRCRSSTLVPGSLSLLLPPSRVLFRGWTGCSTIIRVGLVSMGGATSCPVRGGVLLLFVLPEEGTLFLPCSLEQPLPQCSCSVEKLACGHGLLSSRQIRNPPCLTLTVTFSPPCLLFVLMGGVG